MSVKGSQYTAVMVWLVLCIILVFAMVLLGGAVRLTGSGLSMVEWQPIMGAIPPLNEQEWLETFAKYKQYPEYQQVNSGMALSDFQFIFLMEYFHRLLGRIIGLVFFLPMLYFWFAGRLNGGLKVRLLILLLLGGLQGLMGWYMVKSGLFGNPEVSHYRLTLHLLLAVIIYGYMIRIVVGLSHWRLAYKGVKHATFLLLAMVFIMIATGGLVAGSKAGFIYNTFPKMHHDWVAPMIWQMQPFWRGLIENPIAIQFLHRVMALIVLISVFVWLIYCWPKVRLNSIRYVIVAVSLAVVAQLLLGISTLVLKVPLALGVLHQGGALIVLGLIVWVLASGMPKLTAP